MARVAPCGRGADPGAETNPPPAPTQPLRARLLAPLCAMDFSPPEQGGSTPEAPTGSEQGCGGTKPRQTGWAGSAVWFWFWFWAGGDHVVTARGPGPAGKLVCHLQRWGVGCPCPRRALASGCVHRYLSQSDCLRVSLPVPSSVCVPELLWSRGGGGGGRRRPGPYSRGNGLRGRCCPHTPGQTPTPEMLLQPGPPSPNPESPSTPSPTAGWRRWRPPDRLPRRGAHTSVAGEHADMCSVQPAAGLAWSGHPERRWRQPQLPAHVQAGPGGSDGGATDSGRRLGS